MKKANRIDAEKQKDKKRLMALTREKNNVWCYDGKTSPDQVCRYILGIYYEISLDHYQVYLEYYHHGKLVNAQSVYV